MKLLVIINTYWRNMSKKLLKFTFILLLIPILSLTIPAYSAKADLLLSVLAQGDAITDPYSLLRYALPIDNKRIRRLQGSVEDISTQLRRKRWPSVQKDAKDAAFLLAIKSDKLLEGIPESQQETAQTIIDTLKSEVSDLQEAIALKDSPQITTLRKQILSGITDLEEMMVQEFPFDVPEEYANLPQLKGRATVELETSKGMLTLILDGYSAPVTAGNFVDLVQRGFYDGLPFIRSEDFYVLQTGDPDPKGKEDGFVDPKTGEYRAIPLEILVKEEKEPFYGETLEELGIYLPDLALPFNSYGAVALARPSTEPNGGSSQFFFFKYDSEVTPPGFNLMDGRYAVFGYVVEGQKVLEELTDKDKIIAAKVTDGLDNLENKG
ncbi:MAG: peptidylprolyl isomerase [Microcystaceae cyanobacterium]